MIQPGMHPDADTLTAFAEHLLTVNEHDQVLAHAAVCSRCREVIFLAEQASEGAPLTKTVTPSPSAEKPRSWWWGGLRWAWIPTGALAALIGVVVVLHFRSVERQTQMAQNLAPKQAPPQVSPPPPAAQSVPAKTAETNAPQKAKPQIVRDQPAIQEREEALDQKGTTTQRESTSGAAAPPKVLSPGAVGGSVHGAITARTNSTPFGGPMANDLQQNAMQQQNAIQQQNNVRQSLLQSAQGFNQPADKRKAPGQAPVAAATQPISVPAEQAKAAPMAPPTPPTQPSYVPMSKTLEVAPIATANLKKAAKIALPGGAQPLSVAFDAGRTVALDTSGALFLSEDHGMHWQPVATQWTGRAVLVRTLQQNKDNADILQSLQIVPAGKFELVNDKLQTWKSPDGKTWTAETTPRK